ncbi:putative signal peptide-containing protein [Cryptosporidium canis]|uniref:Signal peptide-containing protein n=1 Tax=Cryptosporidium canis TaxID=195482 RepID=A0A9D5DQK3_9CRYT|nr:putative signal peptide-containing protein [Cryptosporidium canis]
MTETQKALHLLEEAEYVVSSLLELERGDLEKGLGDYMALKPKMEVLLRKTSKYRKFLAIKDPSRQIYGPKMLEKMRDMCSRFEDIDEKFEEQLQPIYENIEAEHKRRLQEMDLEERRRREEEFQRRVQEGIQETYLEEKRRLERLRERQEAERRRLEELDRLNQHEKERLDEVNRRVATMAEFIRSLETGGALGEFADTDVYSKVDMEDLKIVGIGILLLLRQESELKEFYTCLGLISDLLVSILRDPSEIKYRLVRLNNDNFFRSFGDKRGALALFFGIGFRAIKTEERREYYEILTSETDLQLNISRLNSDDEYIVLREPDPIDKFELWVSWMENLALISDILVS